MMAEMIAEAKVIDMVAEMIVVVARVIDVETEMTVEAKVVDMEIEMQSMVMGTLSIHAHYVMVHIASWLAQGMCQEIL